MRWLLTFTTLFFTISYAHAQTPLARTGIKIGYLTDLSGMGAFYGRESVKGAKFAIEQSRAEGIDVQLVLGDHKFKTTDAIAEAGRMLRIEKIDALAVDFSPLSIAVSPMIAATKTLAITICAAKSHLARTPTAFRSFSDYDKGCFEIASYWKTKGITQIGMLKSTTEFGEICAQAAKRVYPQLIEKEYTLGEDTQSPTLAFKQKGVGAIINAGLEGDLENTLKSLIRLNYKVPVANSEPDF